MRESRRWLAATLCFSISFSFGGCFLIGAERSDPAVRLQNAESLAVAGGFERLRTPVDRVGARPVAAWVRAGSAPRCVRVYIEGDGLAWKSRHRVSTDPTPVDPIGLRLALADPSRATVVYLARPCQYEGANTSACHPIDWTDGRFGAPALDAMEARLQEVVGSKPEIDLTVIGFSGGGVIASLLAARRDDIDRLITIAAPLDLDEWARIHGFPPLMSSRSPMDEISKLRAVQQDHYAGTEDRRVPISTIERFQIALGAAAPSRLYRIDGVGHGDWPDRWGQLVVDLALLCSD